MQKSSLVSSFLSVFVVVVPSGFVVVVFESVVHLSPTHLVVFVVVLFVVPFGEPPEGFDGSGSLFGVPSGFVLFVVLSLLFVLLLVVFEHGTHTVVPFTEPGHVPTLHWSGAGGNGGGSGSGGAAGSAGGEPGSVGSDGGGGDEPDPVPLQVTPVLVQGP